MSFPRTPLYAVVVICCVAAACGPKDKQDSPETNNGVRTNNGVLPDAGTTDAGSDDSGAEGDGASGDAAGDAAIVVPPGDCGGEILLDETITVDEDAAGGQLYARTAWDGQGAWVVYNQPGPGNFEEEIFLARVGCKGGVDIGPMRISAGQGERNYAPAIDSRDGVTHIAWVMEPAGGVQKHILLRAFDSSGNPLNAGPAVVTPSLAGTPVSPTVWEPDVAVLADGTGVVVATGLGIGESSIYMQRYDEDGVAIGDANTLLVEPGVNQHRPSIAAGDDDTLYLGWIRDRDEDTVAGTPAEASRAVLTSVPAGANMIFPAAPVAAKPLATPTDIVRYSKKPGPTGTHFVAFDVSPNIVLRDGTDFETGTAQSLGSQGFVNFRPSVAGGDDVGVVTWYRYNQSPLRGEVMFTPFRFIAGDYQAGPEVHIATDQPGIPPFGPAVTWAGGNTYFIAWSEGAGGVTAKVKGRFVGVGAN